MMPAVSRGISMVSAAPASKRFRATWSRYLRGARLINRYQPTPPFLCHHVGRQSKVRVTN